VEGLRIGIIRELTFGADTDAEVRAAVLDAARRLEGLGATVEETSLPLVPLAGAVFMALADAVGAGLHQRWLRTRPLDYDEGTRRRPLSVRLLGGAFDEAPLLRAARAYEQGTDWSRRRPPLA